MIMLVSGWSEVQVEVLLLGWKHLPSTAAVRRHNADLRGVQWSHKTRNWRKDGRRREMQAGRGGRRRPHWWHLHEHLPQPADRVHRLLERHHLHHWTKLILPVSVGCMRGETHECCRTKLALKRTDCTIVVLAKGMPLIHTDFIFLNDSFIQIL